MPQTAAVQMQTITIDGQEILYIPSGMQAAQAHQQMVSYVCIVKSLHYREHRNFKETAPVSFTCFTHNKMEN